MKKNQQNDQLRIKENFDNARFSEPVDFKSLLEFLSHENKKTVISYLKEIDRLYKDGGIRSMGIQERFIFFKLLERWSLSAVKELGLLSVSMRDGIARLVKENDFQYQPYNR